MKTMNLVLALTMIASSAAHAQSQTLLHCTNRAVETDNGSCDDELTVTKQEDGSYSYFARKCSIRFSCAGSSPKVSEVTGPLEREVYQGNPTSVFHGDQITLAPICGRTEYFNDEKNGITFYFQNDQCNFSNDL